jgi:hypothetical protein
MHLNKNNALALFLILATLVLSSIPNWAGYTAETEDLATKVRSSTRRITPSTSR